MELVELICQGGSILKVEPQDVAEWCSRGWKRLSDHLAEEKAKAEASASKADAVTDHESQSEEIPRPAETVRIEQQQPKHGNKRR